MTDWIWHTSNFPLQVHAASSAGDSLVTYDVQFSVSSTSSNPKKAVGLLMEKVDSITPSYWSTTGKLISKFLPFPDPAKDCITRTPELHLHTWSTNCHPNPSLWGRGWRWWGEYSSVSDHPYLFDTCPVHSVPCNWNGEFNPAPHPQRSTYLEIVITYMLKLHIIRNWITNGW